jgi:hypothetical protein
MARTDTKALLNTILSFSPLFSGYNFNPGLDFRKQETITRNKLKDYSKQASEWRVQV